MSEINIYDMIALKVRKQERELEKLKKELKDYKAIIDKTMNKLKIKQARLINESDYIITDLDLDEIMLCLENDEDNE